MLAEYKMTLSPQSPETAEGSAKAVLDKALRQVGFIPNMYANMVHSPGVLNTYLDGYAAFRNDSGFTPAEQEVVFLAISRENGCEYCVGAHSLIADKFSGVPVEVTDAIRDGRPLPDARLQALAEFTRVMVASRGLPRRTEVDAFLSAGYTERQILEIVLAIAVKTLSNYSNHLFHTELDEKFAERRWADPR
ncbi:carboxymuconolactone decarboxylase family protein [Aromatoleum toluclasticum]|uniref:carboxymuconolactone decarboxylase family protein n=1 Tax=Aromatoleum toluclasticum TaxID=92003 RepID=UPI001D193D1D|nr:carboxymuconolactone decarboxylase family protein [Aromatoleum toluclasticum]MCC4116260.1 carboxymuconolactone decarboxylase family protein [Aromatoleum toluclasticum]